MRRTILSLTMLALAAAATGDAVAGSPAADPANRAAIRNIAIVAMPASGPDHALADKLSQKRVCMVFFEPGQATLTPDAKQVVRIAVHEARKGEAVSIVVADPAETDASSSAPKLWRLRFQAVKDAILRSEGGLVQI